MIIPSFSWGVYDSTDDAEQAAKKYKKLWPSTMQGLVWITRINAIKDI